MMNRKEFYEYVKDNVKEYLPESYKDAEITLQEVEKNNGLKLTGITIPNGDQRIVPRVYLDSFYLEYVIGKDVDSCVGDVVDMYIEAQDKAEFIKMGVPDIFDYEKMKEKLQVRICDQEWNEERLTDKVVTEHGDFAAYYAINLKENEEGVGSIPVTISMMNEWGVSVEQISKTDGIKECQKDITNILKQNVPTYMRPENFYYFSEFPLNENGKVDRKKILSIIEQQYIDVQDESLFTEAEHKLAGIWKKILGIHSVAKESSFFEAGGDSLAATKLMTELKKQYDTEISLTDIFENPYLEQMALMMEKKISEQNEMIEGEL